MKTQFSTLLACTLVLVLGLSPVGLSAQEQPAQSPAPAAEQSPTKEVGTELGWGVGSVLANIFYMPTKITYAGLGLLTGGLGYLLTAGRGDVANEIIYPAVKGTYVVTPSHLKGEEPVVFIGASPDASQPQQQVSAVTPQK
ncbi:MAG: hypothetical protein ACREQP_15340 [Candidatus Binatia bacterium]